jgi:hypothetical protein
MIDGSFLVGSANPRRIAPTPAVVLLTSYVTSSPSDYFVARHPSPRAMASAHSMRICPETKRANPA